MQVFHRNIWKLFFIILATATMLLAVQIYIIYTNAFKEYTVKLENITNITAESTYHTFEQYETILSLISQTLLKEKAYGSAKSSSKVLQGFMKFSPKIVGYALILPNGELFATNSRFEKLSNINLINDPKTKESFLQSLKSDQLIIGRTYIPKSVKKLIIPIRKRIVNSNGEVVAVISAGIDIENSLNFLESKADPTIQITLYRESDQYMQYYKGSTEKMAYIYDQPIDQKVIEQGKRITEQKYQLSMQQIKEQQLMVSYATQDQYQALRSSLYLKKYGLWVSTNVKLKVIYALIYYQISLLLSVFIAVVLMIYILFKVIDRNEKRKQDMLFYQSTHDYLTNLYNRFYYSRYFRKELKKDDFVMFVINIDNFKRINDSYEYDTGDLILKEVSKRLKKLKNDKDILIRYSGDEFIFIRYGLTSEEINEFITTFSSKLKKSYAINATSHDLTFSTGVVQYPEDCDQFLQLKPYSDIALREAKKSKNKAVLFNSEIHTAYKKSLDIENELATALLNKEFYMQYQPQFDKNKKLVGVEALLRWNSKKLGFISPDQFIPISESSGFIHQLGEYVLTTSLNEIKQLQDQLKYPFNLSINISAIQLREENFYEKTMDIIEQSRFPLPNLTLEITESVLAEDINQMIDILNAFKKEGIQISLDDFGTGYSSLSLLKKLPINELKIDKSFVQDMNTHHNSNEMISTIITIGKNENLKLVAEGVEEFSQFETLQRLNCDLYQGYLFAKPLNLEALEEQINQQKSD